MDPKGEVISARFDREGNLWIGSTTALYRYLGEAIRGLDLRHPGGETEVAAHFVAADGSTFVATRDQRFWRLAPDGELQELTSRDGQGRLLLRPDLVDPAPGALPAKVPAPSNCKAFVERDGAVWVGVDSGLVRWRAGRLTLFSSVWQPVASRGRRQRQRHPGRR